MKRFKLHYKIIALVLTIAFTFQSMHEINGYTYTTGIDNIHTNFSCLDNIPTHIDYYCSYYNCNWNN